MRQDNRSRNDRRTKYKSRYVKKYGYTTQEVADALGWSYGTVHAAWKDDLKRNSMLDLMKLEKKEEVA